MVLFGGAPISVLAKQESVDAGHLISGANGLPAFDISARQVWGTYRSSTWQVPYLD
jgi:hypothetical protein